MTVTIALDVGVARAGASGGIEGVVTIDFYDPFPETSGGLIRPFELLALGVTPLDWFEFSLTINLELTIFVEVGVPSLGIIVFEKRWTYKEPIVGPLFLIPKLNDNVAELDAQTGILTIQINSNTGSITCASTGGTVGLEGKFVLSQNNVGMFILVCL